MATAREWPAGDAEAAWLADRLTRRGLPTDIAVWDDPAVDWSDAALTLPRSTWDYHRQPEAFLRWVEAAARVTRLENPPDVIRANAHKSYLSRLGAAGIPVVPAVTLNEPTPEAIATVMRDRAWRQGVLKPLIGADGEGVTPLPEQLPASPLAGEWMVQPLLESVLTEGEVSVVAIEGILTTAVRKRPAAGELRNQPRYGGTAEVEAVGPEEAQVAGACLAWLGRGQDLLYARVDLARFEGSLRVMEVELIEPTLYLDMHEPSADAFERGLRRRLLR